MVLTKQKAREFFAFLCGMALTYFIMISAMFIVSISKG